MATIKMDVSEYEAMVETKQLLEKSIERERDLKDQVDELHGEKIKALEDAQKKVIKLRRKEIIEHKLVKRPLQGIKDNVRGWLHHVDKWTQYGHVACPPHELERALQSLINYIFDTTTSESLDDIEEITTHGLDEIQQEIREEYRKNQKAEEKAKLEEAGRAIRGMQDVQDLLNEKRDEVSRLNDLNDELKQQCADQKDKIEKMGNFIIDQHQDMLDVKDQIGKHINIFNAKSRLKLAKKGIKDLASDCVQFLTQIKFHPSKD